MVAVFHDQHIGQQARRGQAVEPLAHVVGVQRHQHIETAGKAQHAVAGWANARKQLRRQHRLLRSDHFQPRSRATGRITRQSGQWLLGPPLLPASAVASAQAQPPAQRDLAVCAAVCPSRRRSGI